MAITLFHHIGHRSVWKLVFTTRSLRLEAVRCMSFVLVRASKKCFTRTAPECSHTPRASWSQGTSTSWYGTFLLLNTSSSIPATSPNYRRHHSTFSQTMAGIHSFVRNAHASNKCNNAPEAPANDRLVYLVFQYEALVDERNKTLKIVNHITRARPAKSSSRLLLSIFISFPAINTILGWRTNLA